MAPFAKPEKIIVQVMVDVECTSLEEASRVKEVLSTYLFKAPGFFELDRRLTKKEYLITHSTKEFIIKKPKN